MNLFKYLNLKYLRWYLKTKQINKKNDVVLKPFSQIDNKSTFEGLNLIQRGVVLKNSKIGRGTYISANSRFIYTQIGRFCSIGQNVKNGFAEHPSRNFVSTHPAFFSTKKQAGFTFVKNDKFEEHKYINKEKGIRIKIGNDVWIGHNVLLLDGICIGDGAIIAAGAVVTKNIEPYTIVGGVPAKPIRKRFNEKQIAFLLELKWWNKDLAWIKSHKNLFTSINKMKEDIER
ncbi:MAG: CatB-related O-acetyltransferase [Candidatus Woesearchaeota archaeon]